MQNTPQTGRKFPGLELQPFPMPITRSKFDVAVFMRESGAGMTQEWLYSTELFDRTTILRMAAHFENLLRHAVTQPETRLSAMEFESAEEKRQREKEKAERRQSQKKRLAAAKPQAVNLAGTADEER
jgi:non-ribosomal peptide synthetase component F